MNRLVRLRSLAIRDPALVVVDIAGAVFDRGAFLGAGAAVFADCDGVDFVTHFGLRGRISSEMKVQTDDLGGCDCVLVDARGRE